MEGKDSKDAVNSTLVEKDATMFGFSDKREWIFLVSKWCKDEIEEEMKEGCLKDEQQIGAIISIS